jgi:hypothetical protein
VRGGGCTPTPFHSSYHHVQSCSVCSNWDGRYTHPVLSLPVYVLCGFKHRICASLPDIAESCAARVAANHNDATTAAILHQSAAVLGPQGGQLRQVSPPVCGGEAGIGQLLSSSYCTKLQRKPHLCIPIKGIERTQSQFPHSCVCERFIDSQDRSTYIFSCSRIGRPIVGIYKSSQPHECGNWD